VQSGLAGAASRQKNWPLFLCDIPKSKSPASRGEFMYIETSLFSQTVSVVHLLSRHPTRTAKTPLAIPEKINRSLYRIGVTMFWAYAVVNGIFQSSDPLSAQTPMMFCCDWVTIWRLPAISTTIGVE